MILIAASNSSTQSKKRADYICSGVQDEIVIQSVINSFSDLGGEIQLSEGDFYFTDTFPYRNVPISIKGEGFKTTVLNFSGQDVCMLPGLSWVIKDIEIKGGDSICGIKFTPEVYYCLVARVFISGVTNYGIQMLSGNSQNIFKEVIVRGSPLYGFKLYGVSNQFYSCEAMRSGYGGIAGFNINLTGGLFNGCIAEDYEVGFRLDNYSDRITITHPHCEDCGYDFELAGSTNPPTGIRVFGGYHGGMVNNPNADILFYD